MAKEFKTAKQAAAFFVDNNKIDYRNIDGIPTKVFAFMGGHPTIPNSWEKNLTIEVLKLLLKRETPKVQAYVVAVTQRTEVQFSEPIDKDAYHVFRADESAAFPRAKDLYDNLLLQDDTYIAVLAKVIESTDY